MDIPFPNYSDSGAREKIADLERLSDRTLTNTEYIDGRQASRLLAALLGSYRDAVQGGVLAEFERVRDAFRAGEFFPLVLAAAFDLVANIEYLHGRVVNSKWIYCHREGETPAVYYSFLKQCPRCCLDRGLEPRLSGAQHKPTSHHIGEITTVVSALILQLIANANAEPLGSRRLRNSRMTSMRSDFANGCYYCSKSNLRRWSLIPWSRSLRRRC